MSLSLEDAVALVGSCAWPAEAFWRLHELRVLRSRLPVESPVLELGCGDGTFTTLTGMQVDLAVDREANAVERARSHPETYRSVAQVDLLTANAAELGRYATVFSNSVLEHIFGLDALLPVLPAMLRPGGRLVTTVPLKDMNAHLASDRKSYVAWRQRQLKHRSLWTAEQWRHRLLAAGFGSVELIPYFDAKACRYWDQTDLVGALGAGRYRVAPLLHKLGRRVLPAATKHAVKEQIASRLLERARRPGIDPFCAALVVASVPS